MPEGDVVLRAATRLHAALTGRVLTTSDLRWPSLATADLTGREVLEVVSRGKHLLLRAGASPAGDPPLTLHSHLRMEGSWHVHRTGEPWRRARSESFVRAVLANAEWTAVGHKLGMLDLVPTAREDELVGHLGPDVLDPALDEVAAAARLLADPARQVGEVLLDQRVLTGVGTFFMAEVCFLHRVTPWTPAGEVEDVAAMLATTRRLMRRAVETGSQVTTGDARPGRREWVHGRSGRDCRRCGGTVRVAPLGAGPAERVAFYCPGCQRGPAPTDDGRPQRPLGEGARRGRPRDRRGAGW